MHTSAAARHVGQSELLRLHLDLGISNQQPDNDIAKETNLQMPGKNCKNIQQHRGRRRRRHGHRVGSGGSGEGGAVRGGFVGIFWSINLAILICLAHSTNAVPTDSGNIGNSNSNSHSASSTIAMVAVTPSSITSSGGSSSTTTESMAEQQQPQGQCLLDGLWVAETTVHCEKQASCRAIQRTGHCCPDYKCDCEKDGKTYANGDKLVDPATPCTVCYCKGGEIVCSSVTCFRRDDCMPKYVTGRCCPEYDNCPILDNNPSLAAETSSVAPTTTKSVPVAPPAGFNWNITIKEITKPTEIRITDDNHKVKQTIPTRKVANTEAPTTATTTTTATTVDAESTTTTAATTATATTDASATTATAAGVTTAATSATPTTDSPATPTSSLVLSQDTNQKALPVNSSESLKLIASVGYNTLGPQQKPLVTYNADGLKPLAENDPSKVNIKREYTTEGVTGVSAEAMPFGLSSTLVDSGASAAELEPDTAGSDNIYHIISTTEGPSGSSTTERQVSTDGPTPSSEMSSTYGYENSTTEMELSTEGLSAVSSSESPISSSTQIVHHMEEEEVPQVESNPAYPSLPEDDFSLRDVNFPLVELEEIVEADNKEEQRSIITAFERDNKRTKQVTESTLDTSGSGNGSGSGDMELYQPSPSPTDHMQTQGSSLSQVPLMYSAEDISAETRIQNVSDLAKIRRNQSENETSGELESGSGSGSGELREPTTPRASYVPMQDIDELGSGAGQAQGTAQDPKADAESLKLDESQDQTAADGKVTSRAEKSFVEQSGAGAGQRLDRLYLKRIY